MTQQELKDGTVVEMVLRIARERELQARRTLAAMPPPRAMNPRRLFPDAPSRLVRS
jgi:hypothetical protein